MKIVSAQIYSKQLSLDFIQNTVSSYLALIPFFSDGRVGMVFICFSVLIDLRNHNLLMKPMIQFRLSVPDLKCLVPEVV